MSAPSPFRYINHGFAMLFIVSCQYFPKMNLLIILMVLISFKMVKTVNEIGEKLQLIEEKDLSNPEDEEILETANAMVFMPLFAMRKISAKRKRVHFDANRRNYYVTRYYRNNYY